MMETDPRHILVAGAGIAGLTAAIAFARRGFRVTLLERAAHLQESGAGIQLSPNATYVLEKLGILGLLRSATDQVTAVDLRRLSKGDFLITLPIGNYSRENWGAPYLAAHRGDMHKAMVSAIGYEPGIRVLLSANVTSYTKSDNGVTVTVDRDGYSRDIYGDMLVGADGVRSTVRTLIPGSKQAEPSGKVALRTTVVADSAHGQELGEFMDGEHYVASFVAPGKHLVIYSLRKGTLFNIVLTIEDDKLCRDPESWGAPAPPKVIRRALRWAHPSLRMLRDEEVLWTTWPLFEVPDGGAWSDGPRVVLIGDAAHAIVPFAAQGAAMGIEDADALAEFVAAAPDDLDGAVQRYELQRKARVAKVRKRSRFNGFTYHAGWPVTWARNFFLRRREPMKLLKSMGWLYGYKAPPAM